MQAGDLVAGRYRLDAELGRGGMGAVWRAFDLELTREVALKRAFEGTAGQIRREARVGAGLMHPHVVAVFDTVTDDGRQWLVSEYVHGASLDQLEPLSEERALKVGAQLASALAAIHARGIVHRDIKPANILITEDDVAKLTDLGIARWSEITQSGGAQLTGTLGYVAPEVANGGEATAASDMFSLGATLYAAVEGQSPWGDGADGPFGQIQRATTGQILPYQRAREIAPLLDALLDPDPANRPTAAETVELIAQGGAAPVRRKRRKIAVRRPLLLTAIAALVVCVGLVAWQLVPDKKVVGLGPDPTSVDPCAVIPENVLTPYGEPFVDPEALNFNNCVVSTTLPKNQGMVQSILTFTNALKYPPRPVLAGQLGEMERPEEKNDACVRAIALPDTHRIEVLTKRLRDAKDAPLCAMSEGVVNGVLNAVLKGSLPQRPEPFAKNSLARIDACGLASSSAVAAAVGEAGEPEREFGNWDCTWDGDRGHASVLFAREYPFDSNDPPSGTRIKLGARQALLDADSDDPTHCEVLVVHRRYTPRLAPVEGTPQLREEDVHVELRLTNARSSTATCAATQTLAAAVAAALPEAK